ncbi:TonB-dependent receptor [Cytophagaceae bacterium DM2B3-1]|uniref:TonB-dependent receptor n=1 Tax=Xanthocytophaga flava TaxID=3048013 RepID=A0ABT7CN90_9BACT|nr:TonB-dependent receptor [Xanthocytophaga flavus]MDJ1495147.1 TonB-dependent receptor [Xanthocytophaga flavus]
MLHPNSFLASLVISLFSISVLVAQTGSIKGTVKDSKTNEPLIGAAVAIQGTTNGSITDSEGNFLISKAPVGKQVLTITYISYLTKKIEVSVEAGKQIILNTALDEDAGQTLQEVVVTASKATNTEVAVISEIKSIQQVAVGVSAQQISRSPDRDAAQIARRVPGVSIVDNRFILVRGLSQRYNSVLINDVIAPSTEVDVRSFSFDMIPSNIIDRMLIFKSGAGDLPGEFAGGAVKIYTKSAPEENFTNLTIGTGYRSGTTFQSVEKYKGGKLDFLGFDDGDRSIPTKVPPQTSFNNFSSEDRAVFANKFPNTWGVNKSTVPLDFRLNFTLGRRFDIGSIQTGNITSINYSNTNQFADVAFKTYENGNVAGVAQNNFKDAQYVSNVRLGVLHNWFFRFSPKFTLEFKNLFNQLGFSETVVRQGEDLNMNTIKSYSERYESRSIYSGQLQGKHKLNGDKTTVDWVAGLGYTHRTEPDWKRLKYIASSSGSETVYTASISNQPLVSEAGRFYSRLDESVLTLAGNMEHKFGSSDDTDPVKLKFGFYTERKDRAFKARFFGYTSNPNADADAITAIKHQSINTIFSPANIQGGTNSLTIEEGTKSTDRYDASNTLGAGYVSAYLPLTKKINATLGFRVEYNNQGLTVPGVATKVDITKVSPLPSLNLVYNLSDKQLVRLAYSSTVNRPEFRELAQFRFYDFNTDSDVLGNEHLTTTTIQNADFRWELYPTPSELISVGVFYKYFKNPIESFLLPTGGGLTYTFINTKQAKSYGIEAEIRKSLAELSSNAIIQNLSVVANASYIISRVDMGDYLTLPAAITTDPYAVQGITDKKRPMMNQSPYLVNAGLNYQNEVTGVQIGLLYNVYGKRIYAVGNINTPTVYEMPRNVIDLTASKTFNKKWEVKLAIQDILNQRYRLEQDFTKDSKITSEDKQPNRVYRRGTYSTISLSYNF